MVGRLTRRIYIYGLDGLVGIPENFDRFAAYNMREIKQLHAASKKPAVSVAEPCPPEASAVTSPPLRWSAANTLSEIPSCIQESNPIHQSFSGNQAVMGVTYPLVLGSHPGASSLAPIRAVHTNFGRTLLARTRLTDLHGSCSA
jgi:hypothetical protein